MQNGLSGQSASPLISRASWMVQSHSSALRMLYFEYSTGTRPSAKKPTTTTSPSTSGCLRKNPFTRSSSCLRGNILFLLTIRPPRADYGLESECREGAADHGDAHNQSERQRRNAHHDADRSPVVGADENARHQVSPSYARPSSARCMLTSAKNNS